MIQEHGVSREIQRCIYCGNIGVTTAACSCSQGQRLAKSFSKKTSGSLVILKSLGNCPKCGTMRTPTDIDSYVRVVCINCGFEEDYKLVKERLVNHE